MKKFILMAYTLFIVTLSLSSERTVRVHDPTEGHSGEMTLGFYVIIMQLS